MSEINQLYNIIKQELEKPNPSYKNIISDLLNVPAEYFNFEFYNLVGNIFQLDPGFFMESIYPLLRKKLSKLYEEQKLKEMEKYILEKFCLHEGEEILYERDGSIQEIFPKSYKIEVLDGIIYVTAHRIIAQGRLRTARMSSSGPLDLLLIPIAIASVTPDTGGGRGRRDIKPKYAKEGLINASVHQELPCYGYVFPIKKLFNLHNHKRLITYDIIHDSRLFKYKLSFTSSKTQNSTDKLFNILKSYNREMFYKKSFRFKGPFKTGIKSVGINYIKDLVKALGGKINDTSAKTLSYFITNKPKSRYLKFQEMGIEILTEQEFLDLIEGHQRNFG
jgi:hypothetical protein